MLPLMRTFDPTARPSRSSVSIAMREPAIIAEGLAMCEESWRKSSR